MCADGNKNNCTAKVLQPNALLWNFVWYLCSYFLCKSLSLCWIGEF